MSKPSKEIEELKYEEAYAELEDIVSNLESGSLTLETSLENFERGQALAQHCAKLLDNAELRVRQFVGDQIEDLEALE